MTSRSARTVPIPQRASQPERKQPERRAPAERVPVLAIEGGGVAPSVGHGPVPPAARRAAAALTAPAHHLALAPEAMAMTEETAAQH
jgi:hypothetical protein